MDEARTASAAAQRRARVDWRSGKVMTEHDDAFWHEHEQRRRGQGLSVPQYCAANALAVSTFRHRVSGKPRAGAAVARPKRAASPPSQPLSFMPVVAPTTMAVVEVTLQDMTLRLSGEAAERVLASVMARLA